MPAFLFRRKQNHILSDDTHHRGKGSAKTILNHPEKYHVEQCIKLGDYNVGRAGQILTLPLYMDFCLRSID